MRVLIAGGGIGGLTAALALRQAGFDAHVYEQASVLREVGAGVQTSPNAVRVLHGLELAEPLREVAQQLGGDEDRDERQEQRREARCALGRRRRERPGGHRHCAASPSR